MLEGVAEWLDRRGIKQWRPGNFRLASAYFAESIARGEVYLAFSGEELVGTLRLLLNESIVWPEFNDDDAVYLFTIAVRRDWADRSIGPQLLAWANDRAAALGRRAIRLDCTTDNDVMRRYYTRAGFEERGEVEAHYPPPVGTISLRRYEKTVTA